MKRGKLTIAETAPAPVGLERCNGKVRYSTRKDAVTTLNHRTRGRSKRRNNRPAFLRAYACDECGGWHLTSGHLRQFP